jgi:carbonic anhydrase
MIRRNPQGDYPKIDKTAYIDPSAMIIGKVKIGKNVFVAPGAVIRADEQKSLIVIGDNCNIQDRVIIHVLGNSSVIIGKNASLAHGCIIHGPCKIGKGCFIGFGSAVFKSELADYVFIKHLAVVEGVNIPCKKVIPNGEVIDGDKLKILKPISKKIRDFSKQVVKTNLNLKKGYLKNNE